MKPQSYEEIKREFYKEFLYTKSSGFMGEATPSDIANWWLNKISQRDADKGGEKCCFRCEHLGHCLNPKCECHSPKPQANVGDREIIEKLADIEHQRWSDWQKYVHGLCIPTKIEYETLGGDFMAFGKYMFDHWQKQIETPYAGLTEKEKQSDRREVMRYWPIIQDFISTTSAQKLEGLEGEAYKKGYADGSIANIKKWKED